MVIMLRQLAKNGGDSAGILRKISSFFKCVMISFLVVLFSICNSVYAQCLSKKDEPSPYVLLQVYQYSQQPQSNSKPVAISSGVLISDKGLILTDYSLLKGDFIKEGEDDSIHLKNDIHIFALKELPNSMVINNNERFELTPIKIHKRRKLLLLEINNIADIKKMNLRKAKIMEVNRNSEKLKSCAVAYEEGDVNEYALKVDDSFELGNFNGGFLFELDGLNFTGESAWGGPVFMDNTDQLIGIISSEKNDHKHMIPIEFADSLLPQVFLSDLKEKFNPVEKSYREHSISWEIASSGIGNMCVNFNKVIDGEPYITKKTSFKFIFTLEDAKSPNNSTTSEEINIADLKIDISDSDQSDEEDIYSLSQTGISQFCFLHKAKETLKERINEFDKSRLIKSAMLVIYPQVSWYSETAVDGVEPLSDVKKNVDLKILCNLLKDTGQTKWLKGGCGK